MYYYLSLYLIIITSIHPYKYICAPWCAHGNQMVPYFLNHREPEGSPDLFETE